MKLKIGGHIYKLRLTDKRSILDSEHCGEFDKEKGFLNVDETLMQSERDAATLHEAMHIMNSELDHELLESLSQQIYAFLKDNKLLKDDKLF